MAIDASHRALGSYDRAVCKLSSGCDVCVFHLGHRSCPVLKINAKPAGIIDRHNTEMKWERSLLAASATLTFTVNCELFQTLPPSVVTVDNNRCWI